MPLTKRPSEEENTLIPSKRRRLAPSKSFLDVLAGMEHQFGANIDEENKKIPPFAGTNKDLAFQVLDICILKNDPKHLNGYFYLSGCTKEGNPVIAQICDYYPYFYVEVPFAKAQQDLHGFVKYLNPVKDSEGRDIGLAITVELVVHQASSLMKVYASNQDALQHLQDNGNCRYEDMAFAKGTKCLRPKGDPLDLFLFESQLSCLSSWINIKAWKYRRKRYPMNMYRNNIHISVSYMDLMITNLDPPQFAPLRMLSLDIETQVLAEVKPDATKAEVYQICCMVSTYGQAEPSIRKIFAVHDVKPIDGLAVETFPDEYAMLKAWKLFFDKVDADVLIGHNIALFDYPYLLKRLEILRLTGPPVEFSRLPAFPSMKLENKLPSDGLRWDACALSHGRVILDTMHLGMWNAAGSFRLNDLANDLLGDCKEDVHFTQINSLQNGDSETRRKLAQYCAKDTWITFCLSNKMNGLEKLARLSRKHGIVLSSLLVRTPKPSWDSTSGVGTSFVNQPHLDYAEARLYES